MPSTRAAVKKVIKLGRRTKVGCMWFTANFYQCCNNVAYGEDGSAVIVTRHGIDVAALVSLDTLAKADAWDVYAKELQDIKAGEAQRDKAAAAQERKNLSLSYERS